VESLPEACSLPAQCIKTHLKPLAYCPSCFVYAALVDLSAQVDIGLVLACYSWRCSVGLQARTKIAAKGQGCPGPPPLASQVPCSEFVFLAVGVPGCVLSLRLWQ
jgi:hypothetical protein